MSNSISNARFRSNDDSSASRCDTSVDVNRPRNTVICSVAIRRSWFNNSSIAARWTSAAAARVCNVPASSSAISACFLQNVAARRSPSNRSSAIRCFAIAAAERFCACAAASAALCVTVFCHSTLLLRSALCMACSATFTAREASARLSSSSARNSFRALCNSSTNS